MFSYTVPCEEETNMVVEVILTFTNVIDYGSICSTLCVLSVKGNTLPEDKPSPNWIPHEGRVKLATRPW